MLFSSTEHQTIKRGSLNINILAKISISQLPTTCITHHAPHTIVHFHFSSTSVHQLAWTKFHLSLFSYHTAGKANGFAAKGGLYLSAVLTIGHSLKNCHIIMGKFLILMILCIGAGMAITFGPYNSKQKFHSNRVWDTNLKKLY